ncbi:MAG: hypothetical protein ACRYHA_32560 [Janthinobacterium lividum]
MPIRLRSILAVAVLASSVVSAYAQSTQADVPPPPQPHLDGDHHFGAAGGPGEGGPSQAAIGDVIKLARLYELAGRQNDLIDLYQDVLSKTTDPAIRHFVVDALVEAQLRPANPDLAITTMHNTLLDDLAAAERRPMPPLKPGAKRPMQKAGE